MTTPIQALRPQFCRGLVIAFAVLPGVGLLAQTPSATPVAAQTPAGQLPGPIRLVLPPRLYAVPGIEMNVYFDNVCLVVNPANLAFDVTCAKGSQQAERWTCVPTDKDVGEFPLVIEARNEANTIIARAESTLQIVPRNAGAGVALSVLTIGDSLTHAAVYPAHLIELCKAEGNPQLTLVGHAPNAKSPAVRIEGYGGWTAQRFMTYFTAAKRPEGDLDWKAWNACGSPFLYPDGEGKFKVDFAQYCQEQNRGQAPDAVTILLGCNDNAQATEATIDASIDAMCTYYDLLVDMVHQVRKDTKIGALLLVPPAATQDAFGANYQCALNRWQYKRNQHRVVERLLAKYGNRESEFIYLIPAYLNLDGVNNYPTTKAPCNAASQTEIRRLSNGLHPSTEGYRQIGDSLYCWLKAQSLAR
jgi:lysophospholipase L1-like esterase